MPWLAGGLATAWAFADPAPATAIKHSSSAVTFVFRNRIPASLLLRSREHHWA
jgi:hypothetical protein